MTERFGLKGEATLLLTVGFCGGFTTFSTFMNENLSLLRFGNFAYVALYTGGSVVIGLFDDIKVLGDDGFKDYLKNKLENFRML